MRHNSGNKGQPAPHGFREPPLRHQHEVRQDDLLELLLDDVIAQVQQRPFSCTQEESAVTTGHVKARNEQQNFKRSTSKEQRFWSRAGRLGLGRWSRML